MALDTLRVLVRFSPTPLSSVLVDTAFSTACHCILNSDDNNTLQSGGELIRTYISVAPQQITEHRDNDGHTGLQYILQIVAQLLNPQVCFMRLARYFYTAHFYTNRIKITVERVYSNIYRTSVNNSSEKTG